MRGLSKNINDTDCYSRLLCYTFLSFTQLFETEEYSNFIVIYKIISRNTEKKIRSRAIIHGSTQQTFQTIKREHGILNTSIFTLYIILLRYGFTHKVVSKYGSE